MKQLLCKLIRRFERNKTNSEVWTQKTVAEHANQDMIWIRRMISHNVRMPMSIINGYGRLLKDGLLSENEVGECVENICLNIQYMNEILSVIFDEDSDDNMHLGKVDIVQLVHKIAGYVDEMAKKSNIKVQVQTTEETLMVAAESLSMMRVFYHLFENSFKYVGSGGEISLNLYSVEQNQVLIVFKDNGLGVAEGEIEHIFEENYRGTNSKGKSGNGYGLYDVAQTIRSYHGVIDASGQQGYGITFFILLPKAE